MCYDIVIIGAGVVGSLIARELSKYELSVCLVERGNDVAAGASKANSGIVHAGFDAKPGSLKALFNVRGAQMMEELAALLDVHYKRNGSLVVAFDDAEMETARELCRRGAQNGVTGLEVLDREKIHALEPGLTDAVVGGLLASTGGIICPYGLTLAAAGNAMDNGVELRLGFEVRQIEARKISETQSGYEIGGYATGTGLGTDMGVGSGTGSGACSITTQYIINAAGIFSDRIAAMIGDTSFHITPRRGEYILLDKECGGIVQHTIFRMPTKMGKGILVSPTADGNLLLGPTSEDLEDRENTATTALGMAQVLASASDCVKDIPLHKTITSFCGLRATSDTGDFVVNRPQERFINAGGIESPGLTASPAIALHVVELLREAGLPLRLKSDFRPSRVKRAASAEKYHKMICRCERVSEGEILEAIHTNPAARTIDAVKRRTRAGMGRCQGGFCMPQVAEILAREYGVELDAITKNGGNSKILI